jgi:NADPH-dependent 2,4-dienoyl-CoA reductase/sulfur reductase-like enzyme/nitrite reductase/ring-hydroxylating ferredoxin subunit
MAEHRIGSATKLLSDGEMKRLELEGKPVVVARADGRYYAFGGNCPHWGAPLNEGLLNGHELMCPWHHTCFDVRTAVRLEPPAFNDLARFPVRLDGEEVVVTLPNDNERQPQGKRDPEDGRHFVIIGGGAVGNAAAEELRRQGYRGGITILSAVGTPPIDRPNISKDYMTGSAQADWIPLRDEKWYAERDIDLRLKTTVIGVDLGAHTVALEGGETIRYDKLLLAMGGVPRTLSKLPGGDLKNILTLRTLADADRIIERAAEDATVVIIGSSFIGMEVASSIKKRVNSLDVTVVDMVELPYQKILGDRLGKMFKAEHEANGVKFRLGVQIEGFEGDGDNVSEVRLKGGDVLPADFVITGVGVRPATDFLKESGLALNERDGAVEVSAQLQTNDADVYAAGDIAHYETPEGRQRIEHWRAAQQQGIVAARNLLGQGEDINGRVPFFWTTQWKIELSYVGHATEWDEIIYRGEPEQKDFIAFYVKGGKLKAAVGVGHDREMDAIEFILKDERKALRPENMRDADFDLVAYAVER